MNKNCLLIVVVLLLLYFLFFNTKDNFGEDTSKIIHQTWKTKQLPDKFVKWSQTCKKKLPGWTYMLWTDDDNRNFIKDHYSFFLKTYDGYDKMIKRVDAVRFFYLYHYGGLYIDLDFECLKDLREILKDKIVLGEMGDGKCEHCIPNAFMYSPYPKMEFWKFCIDRLLEKSGRNEGVEQTAGPVFLKKMYKEFIRLYPEEKENIEVLPSNYLYPIDWHIQPPMICTQWSKEFDEEKCKAMHPDAYAITYWTNSWSSYNTFAK